MFYGDGNWSVDLNRMKSEGIAPEPEEVVELVGSDWTGVGLIFKQENANAPPSGYFDFCLGKSHSILCGSVDISPKENTLPYVLNILKNIDIPD